MQLRQGIARSLSSTLYFQPSLDVAGHRMRHTVSTLRYRLRCQFVERKAKDSVETIVKATLVFAEPFQFLFLKASGVYAKTRVDYRNSDKMNRELITT